uniref:Ycf2 N-terminal domain-containing protein n=1 Tax=Populus trichocarpa TaxID=3694 RepID=A0A2K1ZPS9_POPTR
MQAISKFLHYKKKDAKAIYLVHTHLLFVFQAYSELLTEFKKVKYLMIPSYIIDLRKLLDKYSTSEMNSF